VENRINVLIRCCNRLLTESETRILNKRTDFQVINSHALASNSRLEIADAQADVVVLDSLPLLAEDTIFAPN
jgi:hypothetical protein